jgi:CDP-6-deoxy-D-xylo-4-hexulose-3-dehydrase
MYQWPLMRGNFHADDFQAVADLLRGPAVRFDLDVRLTQGEQVRAFEREFSEWQGCKHSVFVNSGASANLLTMAALRECGATGKVLVPCITWASDITSVLHAGFEPMLVDIDRRTLGMDGAEAARKLDQHRPAAVFLTHCMGYNGLDVKLWNRVVETKTPLFEDCCESIGATSPCHGAPGDVRKLGGFGLAGNFSFYYAHHMTTVEGGMVCTDDAEFADMVRCLRGHGLAREVGQTAQSYLAIANPDLEPEFIFAMAGYNCRNTEIGAAIGRSQLKRLDEGIEQRRENLKLFLSLLDPEKYQIDFAVEGSSPYALTLVLRDNDERLRERVRACLLEQGVEHRRGIAGGGNQLRQPYLGRRYGTMYAEFPNAEHVHWNGWCIGNYPGLERERIERLAEGLNKL